MYSVMQSNGNSFGEDVVLDKKEDNILDQIYQNRYVQIFFMMILILYNIIQKRLLTQQ